MRSAYNFALGPIVYALCALALRLPGPSGAPGIVLACGIFSVVAVATVGLSGRARVPRDPLAVAGLGMLAVALFIGDPPALHGALIIGAAAALGDAFADWISPKVRDLSIVLTAAVCLALFDIWSVTLGPAHNATSGGFLKRLLLDVPTPEGWLGFLGISDLVLVALLAGLSRRRGAQPARALAAGLAGILASLAQAYLTRHPAPALPWIGAFFALFAWPMLKPDRAGWRRTAKWSGITVAALAVATVARLALAH